MIVDSPNNGYGRHLFDLGGNTVGIAHLNEKEHLSYLNIFDAQGNHVTLQLKMTKELVRVIEQLYEKAS